MKLNSPLPQPLPKECVKAARIFQSFVDTSHNGLDGVIPRAILDDARGFAIFTMFKAGFLFSARGGSGVVIARLDDGSWSAPSAIGIGGVGFGGQAGAEMTDFLIVLNSKGAISQFMASGSLTLGGNMTVALGPLGRNGEASGALSSKGKLAAMYSYSKTKGLFGGVSVEGSIILERQDANAQAYNSPVTARMILGGHVERPQWAIPLIRTIESCTGMPGGRPWVNDENARTPGGSYIFSGISSASTTPPRSSSPGTGFLRKKKKAPAPSFPPESWGSEATTGSYFTDDAPKTHTRNHTWASPSTTASFPTTFTDDSGDPFADKPKQHFPTHIAQSKSVDAIYHRTRDPTLFAQQPTLTSISAQHTGLHKEPPVAGLLPLDDIPDNGDPYVNGRFFNTVRSRETSPLAAPPATLSTIPTDITGTYKEPAVAGLLPLDDIPVNGDPYVHSSRSAKPVIRQRDELSKPLLPGEGLARAIALFDFGAVEPGDLSFNKGDVITITKKSDSVDDWWTGTAHGRTGIFPANFVEVV